ncbi:hypothetical protein [Sinorhizobium americanum]|uniref:hypothetical protein n=1 Tax=Sinorhizobium americanum TaxID=194963 RepID=UPI000A528EBB|nr:hypothetical protein [Sinorhizobium americanum]
MSAAAWLLAYSQDEQSLYKSLSANSAEIMVSPSRASTQLGDDFFGCKDLLSSKSSTVTRRGADIRHYRAAIGMHAHLSSGHWKLKQAGTIKAAILNLENA